MSRPVSRRQLLAGGGALATLGLVAAYRTHTTSTAIGPNSPAVQQAATAARRRGAPVRDYTLTPKSTRLDLGGPVVSTWAFGDDLPGPMLRGTAGDVLRVSVANQLPAGTTVHWHGLPVANNMDGVPDVTQPAIASGKPFTYEFTLPGPGTYWYHSHVGVQRERGLYGPLIIDDPSEPGRYDVEWIVVLDDWIDGTGTTPDQVLATLESGGTPTSTMSGMPGMSMAGSSGMTSRVLGGEAGDVTYPYYLLNGRVPTAAVSFAAKPRQKARIRIINAGGDTAFRVALGGHQLIVTHTDGYPVEPVTVDTLVVAMGERYDVEVTLADGVFPLVAVAEGKNGQALGVVRTGTGATPPADARPSELDGRMLAYTDLRATTAAVLPQRPPDVTHDLVLAGAMMPYRWTINGRAYPDDRPLPVHKGQYVRLRYVNQTTMYHPMHLHGHTFALRHGSAVNGPRKDTAIVLPGQTVVADLVANNPGQWVTHCHNAYHEAVGMMTVLSYQT
ncbi:MAG: multicopper oxidase family protein [Pseudonocardiaceae bacterium]